MKEYSVADARRHLPTVIRVAEAGSPVYVTRRGKAVAVVVSPQEYERLKGGVRSFVDSYAAFREKYPVRDGALSPRYFRDLRDRGQGRKVSF